MVDDETEEHKVMNHFEKQVQFLIFRQFCEFMNGPFCVENHELLKKWSTFCSTQETT